MSSETYCRFCALKFSLTSMKNLDDIKDNQLPVFILEYLHIKLNENTDLPKTICKSCHKFMSKVNQFLTKVKHAQQKLNDIFSFNNVSIKLEHDSDGQLKTEGEFENEVKHVKEEADSENEYHFSDNLEISLSEETSDKIKSESSDKSKESKDHQNNKKVTTNHSTKTNTLNGLHKVRKIDFKCYKCELMVQTAEQLQNHFTTQHYCKTEYVCMKCNALFDELKLFEQHLYEHYLRYKKLRYTCTICGKKFSNKTVFTAHEDYHLGIKRFSCNECGRKFRLKQHLRVHEFKHKKLRNKDYKVKCNQCDKICNSPHLLERHMRTHIPNEEKYKWKCEKCERKFVSVENYNNHQILHENENEKDHMCDQCGRSFKNKQNFIAHKASHTTERPFKCDQCTKSFKTERTLQKHTVIHIDVKPYGCEVCGKKFRAKGNLNRHYAVHTEEFPFECEYCHKGFKRKPCLQVHLRQHTGERPYSCTECNHHFTNVSNFLKHLKGKHGLKNVSIANKYQYPFNE